MIDENETFSGTWPYRPNFFEGRGFRHHYIDERGHGATDELHESAECFVCLHGEPTWGYIWRRFVPRLTELGRVIVPDHMGFGKSETPQDRNYSAEEHCDNLDALLLSLDLEEITLVMQDWGGPIGTNFAFRHPESIKRLVYIDSIPRHGMPAGMDMAEIMKVGQTPWAEFFSSSDFQPVMSHLSRTILSVLKLVGFENNDIITPEWIRAYAAPFPDEASCKGAIAFPLNNMNPETFTYLDTAMNQPGVLEAIRQKPAMATVGECDLTLPSIISKSLVREIWPEADFTELPGVGHYAQEDAPEQLISMIEAFVAEN